VSSPGIAVRRTASLRSPMTGRSILSKAGCPAFAGHDTECLAATRGAQPESCCDQLPRSAFWPRAIAAAVAGL
jgi:hypothetical protein